MTEPSTIGLVAALAAASAEFGTLAPDATNPHFGSRYVTLGALIAATRPALARHGLVMTQTMESVDGVVFLLTSLRHTSGETLESRLPLPAWKGPQDAGSVLTYLRRYSAAGMLNVASEQDDDANAAQATTSPAESRPPKYRGRFPQRAQRADGGNHVPARPAHVPAHEVDAVTARWSDEIDEARTVADLDVIGASIKLLPEHIRRDLRNRFKDRRDALVAIERDRADLDVR